MNDSVFTKVDFWLIVLGSIVVPFAIYGLLLAKRAISRVAVFVLGITLIAIAGFDVYFLRHMVAVATATASLADDAVFVSELSFALYLFPLMFGGIGVNLISHILISHLVGAERRFAKEHPEEH